jgi:hypothetical protein
MMNESEREILAALACSEQEIAAGWATISTRSLPRQTGS